MCEAVFFFDEVTKDDVMDCLELGYNLYSVYLLKPVIEEESTSNMLTVKSKDSFVDWELNPLDLFGEVGSN